MVAVESAQAAGAIGMSEARKIRDPLVEVRPRAWREGFQAYRDGLSLRANPYDASNPGVCDLSMRRVQWFRGWYDGRHLDRWDDWLELDAQHEDVELAK